RSASLKQPSWRSMASHALERRNAARGAKHPASPVQPRVQRLQRGALVPDAKSIGKGWPRLPVLRFLYGPLPRARGKAAMPDEDVGRKTARTVCAVESRRQLLRIRKYASKGRGFATRIRGPP